MKRSEMIELINIALEELPVSFGHCAPNFTKIYADLILQELEEAGMAPPEIEKYEDGRIKKRGWDAE